MASYEIVNNTSRYPYDYSAITDGDTLTYTDTTESQYIIPPISAADANKYLRVNNTGTGTAWNTVANELPSNVGITGPSFLQTQNEVLSYTAISQVPSQTGATAGSLLQTSGTTASWTNAPTVSVINTGTGSLTGIKWGSNTGVDGTTTGVNLRVGGVTIVGVSSNTVTSTGVINITATGSAANPSLSFGDRVAGSLSGIYANPVDDNLNFSTNSTERVKISNTGLTVNNNLILSGTSGNYIQVPNSSSIKWGTAANAIVLDANVDATPSLSYMRINLPVDASTVAENVRFNTFNSYFWKPVYNTKPASYQYDTFSSATYNVNASTPGSLFMYNSITSGSHVKVQLPTTGVLQDGAAIKVYVQTPNNAGSNCYIVGALALVVFTGGGAITNVAANTDYQVTNGSVFEIIYNNNESKYYVFKLV